MADVNLKGTQSGSWMTFFQESLFRRKGLAAFVLTAITIIIYSNTFYAPFEFDDNEYIIQNPLIKTPMIFLEPSRTKEMLVKDSLVNYTFRTRYVAYLTFAVNYGINRLDVTGYHVVNLLIHILNVLLVYCLVSLMLKSSYFSEADKKTGGTIAPALPFFAALLFACNPVQTQAVTYISQRFASLAATFCLFSLVSYIKWGLTHRNTGPGQQISGEGQKLNLQSLFWYISTVLSAILAMKTKEISFVLPLIIVLYEFMFHEGKVKTRLLWLAPIILTMIIVPLNIMDLHKPIWDWLSDAGRLTRAKTDIPRSDYLFTQSRVILTYLRLLLLPVNQTIDYDFPLYESLFDKEVLVSFTFLLCIVSSAVCLLRLSRPVKVGPMSTELPAGPVLNGTASYRLFYRLMAFGIFWFIITLSVESSIIPTNDIIFEHRLYLPSVGFFISLTTSLFLFGYHLKRRLPRLDVYASFFLFLLAVFFSVAAYTRNEVWRDDAALWLDAIGKGAQKARGYNELGRVYFNRNENDKAIFMFSRAADLRPDFALAHNNLGLAWFRKGLLDESLKEIKLATELGLNNADTFVNLGAIYFRKGLNNDAINYFYAAAAANPNNPIAYYNLGIVYREMGLEDKAKKYLDIAHSIDPERY